MTDKLRELAEKVVSRWLLDPERKAIATDQIESALREAEDKWQDIATAPKDGTLVLLACNDVVARCLWEWSDARNRWEEFSAALHKLHWAADDIETAPTHWQPLPPPPGSNP